VQEVRSAAYSSDKKTGGSYHPPSALGHRAQVTNYAWCAALWKINGYLLFVIQTNLQSSN